MDTKQIVEKALKGEDFSVDIKDLSDEDKTKVSLAIRDAADVAAKETLAKLGGLNKENERRENKGKENEKEQKIVETFASEQLAEAKRVFFSNPDYALTDAQKARIEAEFKTSKIDKNLILEDLESYYASINAKELLKQNKKAKELEKGAANYNAGQAGGSSGAGSPDESKYSEGAKRLHQMWKSQGLTSKTIEQAQKIVDRGYDWQTRQL